MRCIYITKGNCWFSSLYCLYRGSRRNKTGMDICLSLAYGYGVIRKKWLSVRGCL